MPASLNTDTGVSSPGEAVDPLVAVAKISNTPSPNGKEPAGKSVDEATGPKPHVQAVSDPAGAQTASQGTLAGDQSQDGAAPQGQTTSPPAAANSINHVFAAAVDSSPAAAAVPLQTAVALPVPAGHAAKAPEGAPLPASTVPQPVPVPVVNTARLIQTLGQSEIRVGMRSTDFGNISISTSATRDVISAQISLDHSELARTLAAHVPEMQARLGGNQAMDVRIDMSSQATAQTFATSPSTFTGSGEGSRGEQQPRGNGGSGRPANDKANVTAAGAISSVEDNLGSRLDVRI